MYCRAAELLGGTGAGGGAAGVVTGPTAALVAVADPPSFVAVTVAVIFCPASAEVNVSLEPVAPSDTSPKLIGASPVQLPFVTTSVSPT